MMSEEEKINAIKEVLQWVKSGKQDIENGMEEIDFILNQNKEDESHKRN
jgi:hypothetical protein